MLITNIKPEDAPNIYEEFAAEIGDTHWRRRVHLCRQDIKGNGLLDELIREENQIAFQLDKLAHFKEKYGRIPKYFDEDVLPALGYAAQILSIMNITPSARENLRRRVHGAFKNPEDLRGLRLEITAASHFSRSGKRVTFPEFTGEGTFDLLVEDFHGTALEVECKSISEDKGRKIHYREALDFFALIRNNKSINNLDFGLSVAITIPDRLPSRHDGRMKLAKEVCSHASHLKSCILPSGEKLNIRKFEFSELTGSKPNAKKQELRKLIDRTTGTHNCHGVLYQTKSGGALVLAIQSERDNTMVKAIFKTLSDASGRQLTGNRAGLLIAGVGISHNQLESLAQEDVDRTEKNTALSNAAHRFLSSGERDHIVGLSFLSQTRVVQNNLGGYSSGGSSYCFLNPLSNFWSNNFKNIFP
jgi:hypothetical protein